MAKYFYEYGAVQERTANGPRRIIECRRSGLAACKIPDELGQDIVAALNIQWTGAVDELAGISEADLKELEQSAGKMQDSGEILSKIICEIHKLGEMTRYNQATRLILA